MNRETKNYAPRVPKLEKYFVDYLENVQHDSKTYGKSLLPH